MKHSEPIDESPEASELRAESLKERVYVTFTSLAVVLALSSHAEENSAQGAAFTLFVTVVGTLLAVFLADFISHLAVHAVMPSRDEFRHMVRVTSGAAGVVVVPLILLGAAALGYGTTAGALRISTIVLIVTLAVVGFLAVRRVALPPGYKLLVLLLEVALGAVVVGLELLAH